MESRYPLAGSEDGGGSYTSRWPPCWPVEMVVEVPTLGGLVTVIHGDRLLFDTHQGVSYSLVDGHYTPRWPDLPARGDGSGS